MIEKIQRLFGKMIVSMWRTDITEPLAAVKIAQKRRQENPDYTGKEAFNYFLSVLFPWDELQIVEYNRVVKGSGRKDRRRTAQRSGEMFHIEKEGACPVKPEKKGTFGLYVEKTWYWLTIKERI